MSGIIGSYTTSSYFYISNANREPIRTYFCKVIISREPVYSMTQIENFATDF